MIKHIPLSLLAGISYICYKKLAL